jgi:rhodanese-related sulfurtransferase
MLALSVGMTATAQTAPAEPVMDALEGYQADIPPYDLIDAEALGTALIERELVLLDVREIEEYEAGHIEGAFNVPIRSLGENLNLLPDLDAEIIVICQGGARAMLATAALQTLGYDNAVNLKGGMGAWAGEGFPTTTDPFVPEAATAPDIDETLVTAVSDYLSELPQGYGLVRADALNVELTENPDIFLLDVRSPDEWETGYIAGTEFVWINSFLSNLDVLPDDTDAPIVIYCGSSYRAGIAVVMLELMGYTDVRNLIGGINAWNAAGLPLEGAAEADTAPDALDLESTFADYIDALPGSFNAVRVGDVEEAVASDDVPILLDVRTVDEFTEGHIEGAIHVPLNDLTQNLDLLPDLDAEIIVYCGSGHRSALGMVALNLLGYENAVSLLGGVRAWSNSDLPVTDAVTPVEAGTAPEFDAALFAVVDDYVQSIPQGYYIVRADGLNVELVEEDIFLLDVRTGGEFEDGYIEGATHVPLSELMTSLDALPDADASIVVYDNPTHRSSIAMALLQMLGYDNVRTLGGGYGAWVNSDLPTVTD